MNRKTTTIVSGCLYSLALIACDSDDGKSSSPAQASSSETAGAKAEAKPDAKPEAAAGSEAKAEGGAGGSTDEGKKDAGAPSTAGKPANPKPSQPTTTIDHQGDIRGLCNLKTNFPSDETCIPAPPEGEGMQIHVGPKNYDDADEVAKYTLQPGEENSVCFTVLTPNDKLIHYQSAMLSGRLGTHHIINTMYEGSEDTVGGPSKCADQMDSIGTVPGASKPFMPRLPVPPEYANVGSTIPAHAKIQADMHYYNFTDHPIIREMWLNIYFVDEAQVTEVGRQIAGLGGFSWNQKPIQPGTDKVYGYECPIKGDGYIMSLLGHYHAHGKRFTANLKRKDGTSKKVFEMYDYQEPAQFQYNSQATNPAFSDSAAGAVSGRLAVFDGDVLSWECHIVNDSDVALKYVNEVKTGEMCNLWGQSVGTQPISCYLP
jgi:hypothetical protein